MNSSCALYLYNHWSSEQGTWLKGLQKIEEKKNYKENMHICQKFRSHNALCLGYPLLMERELKGRVTSKKLSCQKASVKQTGF